MPRKPKVQQRPKLRTAKALSASSFKRLLTRGTPLQRHYAPDDALHVAIAVLARQDILVSWNFKHLVNQRRRAAVDALNLALGLPTIAILPPPEL